MDIQEGLAGSYGGLDFGLLRSLRKNVDSPKSSVLHWKTTHSRIF